MEALVPEQMFSTEQNPAHGISAVKAIQLAAAEGQKIYTITQSNVDAALNAITLSPDVEDEIRNAAYAGKEITTHERDVSYFGKVSTGYIILDKNTGAGAYLIDGGEDGAIIMILMIIVFALAIFFAAEAVVAAVTVIEFLAAAFALIGEIMGFLGWVKKIESSDNFEQFNAASMVAFLVASLSLVRFEDINAKITIFFGAGFGGLLSDIGG